MSNEITIIGDAPPPKEYRSFQSGPLLLGGGLEGAQYTSRETLAWSPSFLNPDGVINYVKQTADARGRDVVQNDGYALGAANVHRDSIVGAQYRLNHQPVWSVIPGATDQYATELQSVTETLWGLAADSNSCWLDASRINTFTAMVRLAVVSFFMTGEVCASAEWLREAARPFKTAIMQFSPDRLCNPNGMADTYVLRRGITRNAMGRPIAYSVRNADQYALFAAPDAYTWTTFAPRTPWGRTQMIHIIEQLLPDQSRGVADMVSVLKQLRMTKKFQDISLQNAVINASYAAAIESELPPDVLRAAMGDSTNPNQFMSFIAKYMQGLGDYVDNGANLKMDGAKIPHLFPGTKLNMKTLASPGGVGQPYEASLLRHTAAGLGVSYEELSKDYSQVSYSSARTSAANTEKFTRSRKKHVADRFADECFALWFEEVWASGLLPYPPGYSPQKGRELFYKPLMKEALTKANWIGSGAGQIDELKETQAAILRVQSGLSTYEIEIAKLGQDWREMFKQATREQEMIKQSGLTFLLSAKRPLGTQPPAQDAASEGS